MIEIVGEKGQGRRQRDWEGEETGEKGDQKKNWELLTYEKKGRGDKEKVLESNMHLKGKGKKEIKKIIGIC